MQQQIEGWKILMCYSVPQGCVINKDNFHEFPLIECGSWISDDNHWLLQSTVDKTEEFFQLIPNTEIARNVFFNHYPSIEGRLVTINKALTILNEALNVYILRSGRQSKG